ncbi:MAG: chemotaxis protein CheA [Halanaerobiales bacterium]
MEDELLQTFIEESDELLGNLELALLALENNPKDEELINETFRLFHTIKGSSALVGFENITDFVHHAEDLLDQVRNQRLVIDNEIINLLFQTQDIISIMIKSVVKGDFETEIENRLLIIEKIEHYINKKITGEKNSRGLEGNIKDTPKTRKENVYKIRIVFNNDLFQTGTDPLLILRELHELAYFIDVDIALKRIPDIYEINPEVCYLSINLLIKSDAPLEKIRDVFVFIEIDNKVEIEDVSNNFKENIDKTLADKKVGEILVERGILGDEDIDEALSEQPKIGQILTDKGKIVPQQIDKVVKQQQESRDFKEKSSIKVSTEKLEVLMNSVAELVISQAKVRERIEQKRLKEDQELNASLEEIDKKIRFLQEEVMKARMVPIGNTFLRFKRLVRDLAEEQGKKIDLLIEGRDTELDKTVIEKIADPIKHMIRNAVDHGIELPDERRTKNKAENAVIKLDAYHREGYIVIEISDDGKGLDKEKILKKALEKGIISEENDLGEEEIYNLIFKAGLSTSDEITETSGRGVGMDVVKTNIEELRGSISISTKENQGTTYKIKLPLTLAIIDGMSIKIGDENFIIPINSIIEFYQPKESEIKSITGKGESVHIRGEYLNLFRLGKLFNIDEKIKDAAKGVLIVVKDNDKKVCLLVDEILGQQQAVVKSLKSNYTNIQGIAGATILGNGRVAMIIDVPSLVKMAFT